MSTHNGLARYRNLDCKLFFFLTILKTCSTVFKFLVLLSNALFSPYFGGMTFSPYISQEAFSVFLVFCIFHKDAFLFTVLGIPRVFLIRKHISLGNVLPFGKLLV